MFKRRKKVAFSELCFTDEYYIDGVNVFKEENRMSKCFKNININYFSPNMLIDNEQIFTVKGKSYKFDLAITKIKDSVYAVSFLSIYQFVRAHHKSECNEVSNELNHELLFKVAKEKLELDNNPMVIYSKDYKTRAVVTKNEEIVKLNLEDLEVVDEIEFNFRHDITADNFFFFEDRGTTSYFDTVENALKEARRLMELEN